MKFFIIFYLIFWIYIIILKTLKTHDTLFKPNFIYAIFWLLIMSLYSMNLFNIFEVSNNTLIIIFIGIIAGSLGLEIGQKISIRKKKNKNYIFSNRRYLALVAISIIIFLITSLNGLQLILSGSSLGNIRYLERGTIFSNDFLEVLYLYIATPMSYVIMHVCIYRIFNTDNKKTKYFIMLIAITASSVLTEGGRFIIYYILVDCIVLLLLKKKTTILINNKYMKKITTSKTTPYVIVILCVIAFIYITIDRGSEIYKTIYTYLCGCVPFFDMKLVDFHNKFNGFTYGTTSLNGFLRPFFIALEYIGIPSPQIIKAAESILLNVEQGAHFIAPDIRYNGFVTMFYSFYVDFGIFGVGILSAIYGFICSKVYIDFTKNNTERNTIIYLIIIQSLSTMMLRFYFSSYLTALSLVYTLMIFKKGKQRNN
ncbi:O-antigen polymerase [Thomasclavelia sp.]|uniref:O-antigen polymerase n=1 Tax=Thomasclavelia sp. TaxID=3025757 RepID=UPI0025F19F09|nr:O-antigen polymerase [Thomasclavelia sp.]